MPRLCEEPTPRGSGKKWDAWKKSFDEWDLQNKWKPGTGWRAADMRLGRLSEDKIVLCYLMHYDKRRFSECGYYHHPKNPDEWGASPDGIIHDESLTLLLLKKKGAILV
jgi:hypothetical protein